MYATDRWCNLHTIFCFSVEFKERVTSPVVEIILNVTQLCCFPFAVDTNEELLTNIQM